MTGVFTENRSQKLNLYEQDFCLWLEATIRQLQAQNFDKLDLVNLIEELKSMGRSEKNALESNLTVILFHLLKYKYQPEKRANSWLFSIREHRIRLRKAFRNSPSLKGHFEQVFEECYRDARKLASDETGLSFNIFPIESPFTPEQTLDEEFFSEE